MADDKRAEAMRRAIAASDAKNLKGSGPDKQSKGISIGNFQISGLDDIVGTVKSGIKQLFSTRMGRFIGFSVIGVVLLLIVVSIFSSISNQAMAEPAKYEMLHSVLNVYESDKVKSGYAYDAYVEIENKGHNNIYVTDMSFVIQNERGERVLVDNNITAFPAIIAPGEKGYIYNRFGTELTGIYDTDMEFSLVPRYTIMRTNAMPHTYPVSNLNVVKTEYGQKMVATVENDTSQTVSSIYVIAVVYNSKGYCCGISGQFLRNVEPHMSVNVQFDPLNMVRAWRNEDIVDYVVYAY